MDSTHNPMQTRILFFFNCPFLVKYVKKSEICKDMVTIKRLIQNSAFYISILPIYRFRQSCQLYVFLYVVCSLLIGAFSDCIRHHRVDPRGADRKWPDSCDWESCSNIYSFNSGNEPWSPIKTWSREQNIRQLHMISIFPNQHANLRHKFSLKVLFSGTF